jgi:hypothetical protein
MRVTLLYFLLQLHDMVSHEVIVPLFVSGHVKVVFESGLAGIGERYAVSWE